MRKHTMMTVFVRLLHPYFAILIITPLFGIIYHTLNNIGMTKMSRLSTEVKSTAELQVRGCFTLILGYQLFSLMKILLWLKY